MGKILTAAFDLDRVSADLESKWLIEYNYLWNDNLTLKDWNSWDVSSFVKPECGKKVYDIIKRPGFYADLEPVKYSQYVIDKLVKNDKFEVAFASASPKQAYTDKYEWVKKTYPTVNPDNILFVKNKALVNADILIDDGVHNLEVFKGIKILYDAPWNRNEDRFVRVKDWIDIYTLFKLINEELDDMSSSNDREFIYKVLSAVWSDVQFADRTLKKSRELTENDIFIEKISELADSLPDDLLRINYIKMKSSFVYTVFNKGILNKLARQETIFNDKEFCGNFRNSDVPIQIAIDDTITDLYEVEYLK
jgi:5'(3')-deoxyribonucleotidase